MNELNQDAMSDAFRACWSAAGNRLNNQVEGGIKFWLRAHPYPQYLEHLSFSLGNVGVGRRQYTTGAIVYESSVLSPMGCPSHSARLD